MVSYHGIYPYPQVYRSLQYDTCHHTHIYIYISYANYHEAEQMPCTFFCTKILSSDKSGSLTICWQAASAYLVPMPWSIDFSQQMMFPLGIRRVLPMSSGDWFQAIGHQTSALVPPQQPSLPLRKCTSRRPCKSHRHWRHWTTDTLDDAAWSFRKWWGLQK